ncbi:MAG: nucleotidyltransferase family protein [Acidimicrobiales bacterium]
MPFPHVALFDVAAGRPLGPVTDQATLLGSAQEHRLSGLVWTRVRSDPAWREWWQPLALADMAAEDHHRRLWASLATVVARLHRMGVEVATFKGVTSEARWYERRGERPSLDVDLLLSPAHLDRAGEVVDALQPGHVLAGHVDHLVRAGLLQSIDLAVDGVAVDLHFDLLKLGFPGRQGEVIWELTRPYPLPGGGSVRVLQPEMALVHFVVHLNKDRFRRLLGYADIARVMAREEVDWALFERFVRAEGLHTPTMLALGAVVDTLGLAPVPLAPPRGWRAGAWKVLWRPSVRLRGQLGTVQFRHRQDMLSLLAPGRAPSAVWFWARNRVLPAKAFLAQWYPDIPPRPYLLWLLQGRTRSVWTRQRLWARRVAGRARWSGPWPPVGPAPATAGGRPPLAGGSGPPLPSTGQRSGPGGVRPWVAGNGPDAGPASGP